MLLRNYVMAGLLGAGVLMAAALPGMARPGTINYPINVRSGPSSLTERVDGLPEGTPVEVLRLVRGERGSYWYYVRSTGDLRTEGWVDGFYVPFRSSSRTYGSLSGDSDDVINLRSDPSLNSEVLNTGLPGDIVTVGESRRGEAGYYWYYVTYPNQSAGWVRGDLISIWPKGCVVACKGN